VLIFFLTNMFANVIVCKHICLYYNQAMNGKDNQYNTDEKKFLEKHWEGLSRTHAVEEINDWIKWDLNPVSTKLIEIFSDIKIRFHEVAVKALKKSWSRFEDRFVVNLDTSHQTKSPESILEKMVREWTAKGKPSTPLLNRINYKTNLSDAIRFRFEVNFLEDGRKLNLFLLQEARKTSSRLSQDLILKNKKCNVDTPLTKRTKGERSWKLQFFHKESNYQIELQICTQLQVAWDKKDHFLIYERARKGSEVPEGDTILMKHVSDQLYVVDRQLDEFRRKVLIEFSKK